MGSLSEFSREIADTIARWRPALVAVHGREGRPASGVIWSAGLIVTADHVVESDDKIAVEVEDTRTRATVVGRDRATDIALLRAEGINGTVPAGAERAVRVGELVLAVGRPGQLQATLGIVAGLAGSYRNWRASSPEALIETSAELLPGFSGGPLLDAEGRMIGLNSWNFGQGATRALPRKTVDRVVESLQLHGRIRRPYLGLGVQPVQAGLMVVTVDAGGPAASGGVLQGDILVGFGRQPVRQLDELFEALRALEVGSTHRLELVRAGESRQLDVRVGERT